MKATHLAQDASIQEVVSKDEIESDIEKGILIGCILTIPKRNKILQKLLPKIEKVKSPRQTPIH